LARAGYWKHDYRYIVDAVKTTAPAWLIDIGCGTGAFLQFISENIPDIRLYGLDLSEGMVREVNSRMGTRATVYQGDSEHMPLSDGQFDFVTCNMSIHHYPQAQLAVNEMLRIVKAGGTVCINDMDCVAPIRWVANKIFPHLKSGDVKMYCRQEIEDMDNETVEIWWHGETDQFTFEELATCPTDEIDTRMDDLERTYYEEPEEEFDDFLLPDQ